MSLDDKQKIYIERLYTDMYDILSAYARSALNDRSLAEEAVQDTFRIACVKADELASSPNPKGWLLNTLKNVIRNTVKSRARFGNIMMSIWSFDENMADENAGDETIDAEYADLVVDKDYILLKKIIFEEYTMLEAAEELGLSLEACKKRIQRTKKKLRDQLKDI